MDSELLNGSLSDNQTSKGEGANRPRLYCFTDLILERFPYFLSIGMTEKQYFDGDPQLAIYYAKAQDIKDERKNQELWLQGMYVYDGIMRLVPVLRAFAKKHAKPVPYMEEPYPLNEKQVEKQEEREEKVKSAKGIAYMQSIMLANNKRFEKEGDADGNND